MRYYSPLKESTPLVDRHGFIPFERIDSLNEPELIQSSRLFQFVCPLLRVGTRTIGELLKYAKIPEKLSLNSAKIRLEYSSDVAEFSWWLRVACCQRLF